MLCSPRLLVAVTVAFVSLSSRLCCAQGTCRGVSSARFDSFCQTNCNHNVPYCPAEFCICDGASPSPSPDAGVQQCVSVTGSVGDDWCNLVCNANPPFCPPAYCSCSSFSGSGETLEMESFWESEGFGLGDVDCCLDGRPVLYFTETNTLYKMYLDDNSVQTCAELGGDPNDIVIDQDGDVWVTAPVANALFVVRGNCTGYSVSASWASNRLAVGHAVTIANGNVYVAGSTGIYELTVNEDKVTTNFENTGWTPFGVGAMTTYNDCIYFTVQDKDVLKICPETMTSPVLFLRADEYNLPDIKGVAVTSCGLYVTVTDNNEVWRCSGQDGLSALQCDRLCELEGIDTDTCVNLGNPWGLTIGCCCDVYAVSREEGTIVRYDGLSNATYQDGELVLAGRYHPKGIAFTNEGQTCDIPPSCISPPPTPSPTPSQTPSQSATLSQTPSPSSSPSQSPSEVPTGTATQSRSQSQSQSQSMSLTQTPTSSTSPSPTQSPTQSGSPSTTPTPPNLPLASYCVQSDNACAPLNGTEAFIRTGNDVTLTVTSDAPITITSASCWSVSFTMVDQGGGTSFSGTVPSFTVGANDGSAIACTVSALEAGPLGRSVSVPLESTACAPVGDDTPPSPNVTVDLGPGVDVCVGNNEDFAVTVTSDSPGQPIVSVECNGSPIAGDLGVTPNTFVVANDLPPNESFTCTAVVSDPACNTVQASASRVTCPPIGRLVGDVQRPTQAGSAVTAISVGVVSTQLLECVAISPGETPSSANCRTAPEEVGTIYSVPTLALQLLMGGTTLQFVDPAGVSPIIRLNQLVPSAAPGMCFIYSYPVFNDAANSKTTRCQGADLARCIATTSIQPACITGSRAVNKENDILPRIRNAFANPTEAALLDTSDILSITGNICPGNTINEYSVSYVHYASNGITTTADKPSLSPRPTYIDSDGFERAPAICIDTNLHPILNGMINSTKGTWICLQDPDLVVSNPDTQLAGFKPPPGEVIVRGDVVPINGNGDNKDVKACPFRAIEGGSNPARYCAVPTQRKCVQFTDP